MVANPIDKMLMDRGVGIRHASWREPQVHTLWADALNRLVCRTGRNGFMAVLLGRPGTGKTQMASEWLRFVLASTKDPKKIEQYNPGWLAMHVLYRKASDVFRDIRETYDTKSSERTVIDRFRNVTALVVDEIDNRARTDFENRILRDILDDRYRDGRDTVLVTNAGTLHVFLSQTPAYLRSRLAESGLIVDCSWPSFREK